MLFCEFCEISKNTVFTKHLQETASFSSWKIQVKEITVVDFRKTSPPSPQIRFKLKIIASSRKLLVLSTTLPQTIKIFIKSWSASLYLCMQTWFPLSKIFSNAILQADIRGMVDAWVMNQFLLQKSKMVDTGGPCKWTISINTKTKVDFETTFLNLTLEWNIKIEIKNQTSIFQLVNVNQIP